MWDIIRELYDFTDTKTPEDEPTDEKALADRILNDVILALGEEMSEKGITCEFKKKIPQLTVMGDESMVVELFFNIVENAVIFGRQGGRIQIEMEDMGRNLQISVTDDGVGIPPSELNDVFKSYYRVAEHTEMNMGGLGLGLSMAKHIAEYYEGDIRIESQLSQGTTVFVTLPK